jgi:DNA polymerase elongation subunit (family B)
MYQSIHVDRKSETIFVWDDIIGLTEYPLHHAQYAYRKQKGGPFRSMYGDALQKITRFNPKDPSLFESDVPIETRVLIDLYEDSDEPSKNVRVMYYDIETSSEGGFPDIETADKEITAIALYDNITARYTAYILDKSGVLSDSEDDISEVISCDTEETLLLKFLTKLEEIQPHIWTGWNIDGFDNPYLYGRIKRVLGNTQAQRLSPIGKCYINTWNDTLVIAGISSIDYMVLYKKWNIKMEASYALGAIGKKILGRGKVDYTGSLDDLYKTDIKKYIEYNLNDVIIVVELEKKLLFMEQARQVCHKGHVPYNCFMKSSRFIEGAILMYLRRKGQVAKNKPADGAKDYEKQQASGDEGFEGAYVKDPVPGRYDWVFDLDLTSMYPNIIISLNISPETKIGCVKDWDVAKYLKGELGDVEIGGVAYTATEFKTMLEESNFSIASNGVMYDQSFQGVIPEILVHWFEERKSLRKKAKECADKEDWDGYRHFNRLQSIIKVQLNSIYGVMGLSIFRFYDKENASAVTLTGQDIIKTTDKAINSFYNHVLGKKYKVTYDDGSVEYKYQYELDAERIEI